MEYFSGGSVSRLIQIQHALWTLRLFFFPNTAWDEDSSAPKAERDRGCLPRGALRRGECGHGKDEQRGVGVLQAVFPRISVMSLFFRRPRKRQKSSADTEEVTPLE